jgi:antitoxin (DNA-binding transcriptional repressor) of toxin-antitoxin stability system
MVTRISATELSRSLSDVLNRVHYRGEEFLIERNGETVATLGPSGALSRATFGTLAAVLPSVDLGDQAFADDLEAVQRNQPIAPQVAWPNS